jgi:hypothetical protein
LNAARRVVNEARHLVEHQKRENELLSREETDVDNAIAAYDAVVARQ